MKNEEFDIQEIYPPEIQKRIDMLRDNIKNRSERIAGHFKETGQSIVNINAVSCAHEAILNDPLIILWQQLLSDIVSTRAQTVYVFNRKAMTQEELVEMFDNK